MKLALALALISIPATAAIVRTSRLGPAVATLTATNNTTTEAGQAVTLAAVTGQRNCLSRLNFIANSSATLRILDGGTTVYAIDLATATLVNTNFEGDDMCGTASTALIIKVSTAVRQGSAPATQQLGYTGFTF